MNQKESTVKKYKEALLTLKNKYKIDDLLDYKHVMSVLTKALKPNSIKLYVSAIVLSIDDEDVKLQYRKYDKKNSQKYKQLVGNNQKSEKQEENMLSYQALLDILIQCIDKPHTIDCLFLSLYLLFPPRRLDYCDMYVYDKRPKELDPEKNYYINRRNGYFIFNNYKTSSKYRIQTFEVPEDLNAIIQQYILYNDIQNGDRLVPVARKNFSKYMSSIINRYIDEDKKISCQILRHSFASFLHQRNYNLKYVPVFMRGKKYNFKLCRSIARRMAHSLTEQFCYVKFD